ncbi:hypothetical protein [Halorubellus litoreus]|uniref:Uncharacterized protein n=1 Tax=Halorubellus litoreus TaxID=755308 RepID=A0ABD5VJU2_9EURY
MDRALLHRVSLVVSGCVLGAQGAATLLTGDATAVPALTLVGALGMISGAVAEASGSDDERVPGPFETALVVAGAALIVVAGAVTVLG